jgi:hypothetical protein
MIHVMVADEKTGIGHCFEWNLYDRDDSRLIYRFAAWASEEKLPVDALQRLPIDVIADGNELDYIVMEMRGLPSLRGARSMRWFGDHARFIIANM